MRSTSLPSNSRSSDVVPSDGLLSQDPPTESEEPHALLRMSSNDSSEALYTRSFQRPVDSNSSFSSNASSRNERSSAHRRKKSLKSMLTVSEQNKTKVFGEGLGVGKWEGSEASSDSSEQHAAGDFLIQNSLSSLSIRVSSQNDAADVDKDIVTEEKYSEGEMGQNISGERMQYAVVEDPRNFIITLIIDSPTGSVNVQDIFRHLAWDIKYEKTYGSVPDYLQGYHSIFVLSPIDDRVTLCRPVISSLRKRELKRHHNQKRTEGELISAHIGSISCSCVAERIVLDDLQAVYTRRGYSTELKYGVLHVSAKHIFDIFAFSNGIVVWWGMNRCDHWLVEDDFFAGQSPAFQTLRSPFSMKDIRELYPNWSSYEVDDSYFPLKVDEKASERFSKMLCFDHYRIPMIEPDRSDVMMTVSFCLGRSACIDYYEHVTKTLHQQVLSIPLEFSGLMEYFSTQKVVRSLEGELQVTQLALTTLKDTPNFLWEMPWLQVFYALTELQCSSEHRVSWFCARGDALLQSLSSTKKRRFRLFMLGSDVFLIALLVFDVFFMTARLIVKLYFKVEDEV